MSKLEELIARLCPDGVEYKSLGEVSGFQNGFSFKSNLFKNAGLPILRITNIVDGALTDDGYVYFSKEDYTSNLDNYRILKDDIVVAMSGATTGKIGYNYNDKVLYLNQRVGKFIPNENILNKRYLYHWLLSKSNDIYLASAGTGAQPNLSSKTMMSFELPVPPLEVQREIVHILDSYTVFNDELQEQLEKELVSRQKQYEYYRESLIIENNVTSVDNEKSFPVSNIFGNPIEYKTLAEIGTLKRGKRFVHSDATDNGVPCIHYGELYTYYGVSTDTTKSHIREELRNKMRYAQKNDVVIVGAGENNIDIGIGVAYLGEEEVAVHDAYYIFKHNQNPKYISYCLRTFNYHDQIKKYVSRGKICSISAESLYKAKIPVPPLVEQQRIVDILDRFDALCNDITSGLPAEIEARRKQYEYYRDKLLTFKELKKEA